jgi:hypothetical protein
MLAWCQCTRCRQGPHHAGVITFGFLCTWYHIHLQEGFRDLSGSVVFPNIARVGSEDAAMAETVRKDVSGAQAGTTSQSITTC